jgi:Na+/melibiose symporter-like transporter
MLCVVMVLLQVGIFSRMISASALMSALPSPTDRGSFMSISSSLQQVAGGVASLVSGTIVSQAPGGELLHFDILGYVLVVTTAFTLTMMYFIDRQLREERQNVANQEGATSEPATTPEPLAVPE